MTKLIYAGFITLAVLFGNAYATDVKTVAVKSIAASKQLYFKGTIQPLENVPVISMTAGVVSKVFFAYGQAITKGQPLLAVNPGKVTQQLRDAQVSYLKALQTYHEYKNWAGSDTVIQANVAFAKAQRTLAQMQNTYQENIKLYKLGIISHDELIQSQDSYEDAQTALKQAQRSLHAANEKGTGSNFTVIKLQLENAQQKYHSLLKQTKMTTIKAPASGVILIPTNTNTTNNNNLNKKAGKITVGSEISYQQTLMTIGNLSGLKVQFAVPEVNINQIHVNQKATITGAAFPGILLHGYVSVVAAQAGNSDGGTSLPTFMVQVSIPKVSLKAIQKIRVGMDSQIALTVYNSNKTLVVPVNSVKRDGKGNTYVMLKKDDHFVKQPITTGKVLENNVQVLSGLHADEQIQAG
jgi:HlyD family secretion protein